MVGIGELLLQNDAAITAEIDIVDQTRLGLGGPAPQQTICDIDHTPQSGSHTVRRRMMILIARLDLDVRRLIAPGEIIRQQTPVGGIVATIVLVVRRCATGAVDVDAIHAVEEGGRVTNHIATARKDRDAAHVTVGEGRLVGPGDTVFDDIVTTARWPRVQTDAPRVQIGLAIANDTVLARHEVDAPHTAGSLLAIVEQIHRTETRDGEAHKHHASWTHQAHAVSRKRRDAVLMRRCGLQVRG